MISSFLFTSAVSPITVIQDRPKSEPQKLLSFEFWYQKTKIRHIIKNVAYIYYVYECVYVLGVSVKWVEVNILKFKEVSRF